MPQIQRAALTYPTNIAEGSAKSRNKDFTRFLKIALRALLEFETELLFAFKINYLDESNLNHLVKELLNDKNDFYFQKQNEK